MTRREILIAGALTAILVLITLAMMAWGHAHAQPAATLPIPVDVAVRASTDWPAIITAVGVLMTALLSGIGALVGVLSKRQLDEVHHATNSLLDARVAAEHAVGQMAERDATRAAAAAAAAAATTTGATVPTYSPAALERPATLAEVTAAIAAAAADATKRTLQEEIALLRAEVKRLTPSP